MYCFILFTEVDQNDCATIALLKINKYIVYRIYIYHMELPGLFRFENENFYMMRVQGTEGQQDKFLNTIRMCFQNPIKRLG